LASARENAKATKKAKSNGTYVPDVEYIERIVLPTDVAVANDSDIEEQKDTDFVVDGIVWRVIEDEPGDSHLHVDEDNMYREVLDSEVAGRLRACIEKIDKRWRAVGANGGFYGTSRSSHFRREAEKNLRSKSVKGERLAHFTQKLVKTRMKHRYRHRKKLQNAAHY
jgi:hypothetical protein